MVFRGSEMNTDKNPIMYIIPDGFCFSVADDCSTESEYFEPWPETRLDQIKKKDQRARWRKENKK